MDKEKMSSSDSPDRRQERHPPHEIPYIIHALRTTELGTTEKIDPPRLT